MPAKTMVSVSVLLATLVFSGQVFAQTNTERGALAGGTAGAIIGGIIGHQNDETPEGILIGGAVGALAGGLIGNDHDRQIRHQYYYQQQRAAAYRNGVSLNDVVALSGNGVGSAVIINQIQMNGVRQRIGVNEIIALHQQGVDSRVIDAMQRAPMAGTVVRQQAPPVYHRPVVVEPVYVSPPVRVYPRHYHHHHHHRPRGTSIHFNYRR